MLNSLLAFERVLDVMLIQSKHSVNDERFINLEFDDDLRDDCETIADYFDDKIFTAANTMIIYPSNLNVWICGRLFTYMKSGNQTDASFNKLKSQFSI